MNPRALAHADIQHQLSALSGIAPLAAATALLSGERPEEALKTLELGRGVITGLLMDLRGDISGLRQSHPDLAARFMAFRDQLDMPASGRAPDLQAGGVSCLLWESRANRRSEADQELTKLINVIRTKPNFSSFLESPTSQDLLSAADRGPVIVVNAHLSRSDAFIIQSGSVRVVELPRLTEEGLQQAISAQDRGDSQSCLEWLWNSKCTIFHFAGHGELDPADASRSKLLLDDWERDALTVGDLRDSRLQEHPPFLAYLSACSTGANKATNLLDECIHLANAFQLAGFRHVIGTLWKVSDRHCVNVARTVYQTLAEEGMKLSVAAFIELSGH
ncbi:hypothetical protein N3K66_007203 [Trichothecium roseum]|uniref:Uncharacterized protein n=1 Tax=Trichothecium roseum TaxID=47278 RepID=A0ACC0UVT4_9HYPO|nr:hypothetical protein N3K66_007203 [Trichothecium roseum]